MCLFMVQRFLTVSLDQSSAVSDNLRCTRFSAEDRTGRKGGNNELSRRIKVHKIP